MKNKLIALILGLLCHLTFIVAVSAMAYMLYFGLTRSILPLEKFGRVINLVLVFQFPLLHSFFLSKQGRKLLEAPYPKDIGREMLSTTFGLLASIQLLVVFVFWVPSQSIWFAPTGVTLYFLSAANFISWVLLIVSLKEAGLALHTGFLGWSSIVTGKKVEYPRPHYKGLHSGCRQPIYLSFALIILTGPFWSTDHFIFALVWVTYCLVGPLFKERRFLRMFGQEYKNYRERTSYFVPRYVSKGERLS